MFINIKSKDDREVLFQVLIHIMFICSALGLAKVEQMSHHVQEDDEENEHCEHCEKKSELTEGIVLAKDKH